MNLIKTLLTIALITFLANIQSVAQEVSKEMYPGEQAELHPNRTYWEQLIEYINMLRQALEKSDGEAARRYSDSTFDLL